MMELAPQEVELIQRIRDKYKFAHITIVTKFGLPYSIIQTSVGDKNESLTIEGLVEKIKNTYKYGQITIECRDGLPHRLEKTTSYDLLS